jgi:Fe2+ transport system protein FeoA
LQLSSVIGNKILEINLMKTVSLNKAPLGQLCQILAYDSPNKEGMYRLFELGLTKGSCLTILRKSHHFGSIELALEQSRLCIDMDLASVFLVVTK